MAAFTADSIIDVEFPCLLGVARIKSMANEALRRMGSVGCSKARRSKDPSDALRNGVVQDVPGTPMLVLKDPGAVLVLQNLRLLPYLHRSVTSGSATGTWANIAGFCCRNRLQKAVFVRSMTTQRKEERKYGADSNNSGGASIGATAQPSIHCADSTPRGDD
jgi:hypothetical protein